MNAAYTPQFPDALIAVHPGALRTFPDRVPLLMRHFDTRLLVAIGFGTAWIGTGLLTSIPGTVLIMIGAGWTTVAPEKLRLPAAGRGQRGAPPVHRTPVPVIS